MLDNTLGQIYFAPEQKRANAKTQRQLAAAANWSSVAAKGPTALLLDALQCFSPKRSGHQLPRLIYSKKLQFFFVTKLLLDWVTCTFYPSKYLFYAVEVMARFLLYSYQLHLTSTRIIQLEIIVQNHFLCQLRDCESLVIFWCTFIVCIFHSRWKHTSNFTFSVKFERGAIGLIPLDSCTQLICIFTEIAGHLSPSYLAMVATDSFFRILG